uniref:Uncharacterized protein n=1 Tax=Arundo donax TaxID=35708 RepID=A0A0A9HA78_ARUDO
MPISLWCMSCSFRRQVQAEQISSHQNSFSRGFKSRFLL